MNYCDSLFSVNTDIGDKVAFVEVDSDVAVTYNALRARVKTFASYLLSVGIKAGDIVALHLYNGIDAIVVHSGVQYIGAVSCWIDPLIQPKGVVYHINETRAKLLITHCSKENLPSAIVDTTSVLHDLQLNDIYKKYTFAGANDSPFPWKMDDVCYIYYTSGTTSEPKGVMLTQKSHQNFTTITDRYWQPVDEASRHLCYVPFSHGFGSIFLIPLAIRYRAQLYILRSFHPGKAIDAIDKYAITHIYGVPSHYHQLLRFEGYHASLKKLKLAFCAASKLEIELMEKWEAVTGISLNEGYGLIETDCGITWRVGAKPLGTGHMGECPDPSLIEIGIFDNDNNLLSRGLVGEIVVKGASLMKGYLNKPEENERVFVNGWFKTGDKGYVSNENQLFLTGRIKDIINIAGIKVSPFEVEAVLNKHGAVAQSVVIAVEDALYGEVVKAYVQKQPSRTVTERELIKYVAQHLMNFQVPKTIEFVESFPLNAMGKIDRNKLRTI